MLELADTRRRQSGSRLGNPLERPWLGIAVWEDLRDIEGIEYDSAMNRGGTNYALYERAENALEPAPVSNNPLTHLGLRTVLRNAAVALNYGLALPAVPGAPCVVVTRMPGGSAATRPRRVRPIRRPRP